MEQIKNVIRKHCAGKRVLDIGGIGPWLAPHIVLINKAFEEVSAERVIVDIQDGADLKLDLDTADGRTEMEAAIREHKIDIVFASNVLDHLEHPAAVLASAREAAEIVVIQGNPYSPAFRVLESRQRAKGHNKGHLYEWHIDSMGDLLRRLGWEETDREWVCGVRGIVARTYNILSRIAVSQLALGYAIHARRAEADDTVKYGIRM